MPKIHATRRFTPAADRRVCAGFQPIAGLLPNREVRP